MRGRRIEANSLCRSYTHPHPAAMPPPSPWEEEGSGRMVSTPTQLCNASCGRPPHRYRTAFLCGARRPRRATTPLPKFVILRRSGRIRVPRLQTSPLIRPSGPPFPHRHLPFWWLPLGEAVERSETDEGKGPSTSSVSPHPSFAPQMPPSPRGRQYFKSYLDKPISILQTGVDFS